jgi:hypothetical protein
VLDPHNSSFVPNLAIHENGSNAGTYECYVEGLVARIAARLPYGGAILLKIVQRNKLCKKLKN